MADQQLKPLMSQLLTPDQLKCLYRGNLTKDQAALYIGVGVAEIQRLIDAGEIGLNPHNSDCRISKRELDNYLENNINYSKKIRS